MCAMAANITFHTYVFSASEQNPRQKQIRYVQTTTEILNIRGTGELRYPTTQTYIGVKNEVFLNNFIMF